MNSMEEMSFEKSEIGSPTRDLPNETTDEMKFDDISTSQDFVKYDRQHGRGRRPFIQQRGTQIFDVAIQLVLESIQHRNRGLEAKATLKIMAWDHMKAKIHPMVKLLGNCIQNQQTNCRRKRLMELGLITYQKIFGMISAW